MKKSISRKELGEDSAKMMDNILNWTFPGAGLYYRDAELPAKAIAKYTVGQIIRSQAFIDVSSFAGKPVKSCRYAIATSKAAPLYAVSGDADMERWAMHTINTNSYFKVLDIYQKAGVTQIFLLHIPAKGIGLFASVSDVRAGGEELEKQFIQQVRAGFDQRLKKRPASELEEAGWIERTNFPLGMDADHQFYPLVPEVDIFGNDRAAELYEAIFEMTEDDELNTLP